MHNDYGLLLAMSRYLASYHLIFYVFLVTAIILWLFPAELELLVTLRPSRASTMPPCMKPLTINYGLLAR